MKGEVFFGTELKSKEVFQKGRLDSLIIIQLISDISLILSQICDLIIFDTKTKSDSINWTHPQTTTSFNNYMETFAEDSVILLIVCVAVLSTALGVFTCVTKKHLSDDSAHHPLYYPQQPFTAPMLSVVSGNTGGCVAMERLRGGAPGPHRGERGISSSGRGRHHNQLAVMVAAQRDRAVRLHSVHTDLELDLPPSIALPDGEEHPYGTSARLKLRDDEQESEIYQKCVRPPPNRTVFESESPPPYRSHSAGLLGSLTTTSSTTSTNEYQPLVVRCHSLSSHPSSTTTTTSKSDFIQRTVKIFTGNKKQSTTTTSTNSAVVPCVVVPKQHRTTSVQTTSSTTTSNKNQV